MHAEVLHLKTSLQDTSLQSQQGARVETLLTLTVQVPGSIEQNLPDAEQGEGGSE